MATKFEKALAGVTEVMKFETWLRFYFIEERGDGLHLLIPQGVVEDMRQKHPHLAGLAQAMNEKPVDEESSRREVCVFLGTRLSGEARDPGMIIDPDMIPRVMDSRDLRLEMHLFHLWVTGHEAVLDEEFLDFSWWLDNFARWRDSDEVQAFARRMAAPSDAVAAKGCETMQ